MGDCLPQPWGNIGGCLIMQGRFDEAEVALRRALEIEPDYQLARQNLAMLPELKRSGELPTMQLKGPFDNVTVKKSIIVREK